MLLFGADGAFLHECGLQPPHHGGNRCLRGDTVSVADLPAAIATYVEPTYPGATITTAVQKPNGAFGVEVSTGEVLLVDAEGVFVRICDGQPGGGHGGGPGGGHGGHGGGGHGGGPGGGHGGH